MTENNSKSLMSLYEKRKKIFPAQVKGTFRNIKWGLTWFLLGLYYIFPWIRWDRGENSPNQAVLIDIDDRKFYFFFIEIWPQEVYIFAGMLLLAAFTLFCATAILGRVWCGFLCPQTIWTDLFVFVERKIEGDKNAQARLDNAPWSLNKILKKITKHFSWLFIALATGGAFVLYFGDAPTMFNQFISFELGYVATFWTIALTISTYLMAGFSREQVCIYMCPYSRFQGAMYDENTLMVAYDDVRGEPRGKKSKENIGDCVDCFRCIAVCPTGIDIRDGSQYECINCGLCIDACNEIMDKLERPKNLIRYDTLNNISERKEIKISDFISLKKPRAIIYSFIIIGIFSALLYSVTLGREIIEMTLIKERNPMFIQLSDGSIRNIYKIHVVNKSHKAEILKLRTEADFDIKITLNNKETNELIADPDEFTRHKVFIDVPVDKYKKGSNKIKFILSNKDYNIDYQSSFNAP